MGECPIQHSFLNRAPIRHRLLGYPQLQYTAVMQTRYANRFQANTSPCSSGAKLGTDVAGLNTTVY
jgi:hypothetical protein